MKTRPVDSVATRDLAHSSWRLGACSQRALAGALFFEWPKLGALRCAACRPRRAMPTPRRCAASSHSR